MVTNHTVCFVTRVTKQTVCFITLLAGCATATPRPGEGRPVIDLSGEWEFRMDPEDRGRAEKWFEPGAVFDRKIRVPGAWNAQGVSFESEKLLREYEQRRLNGSNLPGVDRESEKLFSVFPGPAWYRRTIEIPADWQGKVPWLVFGGVHRYADAWVNGEFAGSHTCYLTPFRIDLSRWAQPGGKATVAVRVDARRNKAVDPLMGCMDTLDFLYISWGGIQRPVTLEARGPSAIENLFAIPHVAESSVEVRVEPAMPVGIEVLDADGSVVARGDSPLRIPDAKLWSPSSPYLYTLRVTVPGDGAVTTRFGMREFKVEGGKFLLNGRPIFLRGYGDDCIFPNSVGPTADKEEYRRRLSIARSYGFNYVRHHSWMPPPEYLDLADEMGMMVQPEFPIAYRWDLPATAEAKKARLDQWREMIQLNRNHPSIVAWCMGNELYDSFPEAPEMYRIAKETDPTRVVIDSDGCTFKHKDRATLDFLVVQFGEGGSIGFGDGKYTLPADLRKPVICHEMGYFVTLHDLSQIDLFNGGLRPYWLLNTRELAAKQGVTAEYPKWLEASYKLQAVCLKTNIEAARRSSLGGMSVWLFQDYPNCAEGVVDMFWRPKALTAPQFRQFNAPTVLLLDAPRRSFRAGETVELKILVSRFEELPMTKADLHWELKGSVDGRVKDLKVGFDGVQELATVTLEMPKTREARRFTFRTILTADESVWNEWPLWVFPEPTMAKPENVMVTPKLDAETIDQLEKGGRVLLLDPEPLFQTEKTNYRLSSWDGGGPSGTVIDRDHPALRAMPNDGWADLHFYPLIQGSKTVFLDPLPVKVKPIVRCIDRPNRLANRAYLFEVAVGKGKLLVSGFNVSKEEPATTFLLDQLKGYASGPDFAPTVEIPAVWLRGRLKK
jgi:beta-galactosidase